MNNKLSRLVYYANSAFNGGRPLKTSAGRPVDLAENLLMCEQRISFSLSFV